jgi:hypothetical protein
VGHKVELLTDVLLLGRELLGLDLDFSPSLDWIVSWRAAEDETRN